MSWAKNTQREKNFFFYCFTFLYALMSFYCKSLHKLSLVCWCCRQHNKEGISAEWVWRWNEWLMVGKNNYLAIEEKRKISKNFFTLSCFINKSSHLVPEECLCLLQMEKEMKTFKLFFFMSLYSFFEFFSLIFKMGNISHTIWSNELLQMMSELIKFRMITVSFFSVFFFFHFLLGN